ncbi:hypothetical protein TRFO_34076 [Tritrichomonas foetus]|uniref:Thioredoxin domain-containing protein n=1 Tax=Tritrichomonas foetus TaxID=1144522 RepID=A0A1J4JPN9_9EUKA|nr:hypothetical protein TRFO_34076 [Tritrichomonas foetus]|eukprot:OHS99493.1 hypothetical protein TRFO_34076 [Tritrichomonas foetus]
MFFPLITLILESIKLNNDTFISTVENEFNLPIFVEVWDRWCPHCQAFASTWENLTNNSVFNEKVIFADVDCSVQTKICKKFQGTQTPRFFWIENKKISAYSGSISLNPMIEYIQKQIGNLETLYFIHSQEEINEIKNSFLFRLRANKTNLINQARKIAQKHNDIDPIFHIYIENNININTNQNNYIKTNEEPENEEYKENENLINLEFIVEKNRVIKPPENASLDFFINSRSILPLSKYTRKGDYLINIFGLKTIIFFKGNRLNDQLMNEVERIIEEKYPLLTSLTANCPAWNYPCRYFSSKSDEIVISIKENHLFYKIKINSKTTLKDIDEKISEIIEGKVKPSGPGNCQFKILLYDLRGEGGFRYYILFFPVTIVTLLILIMGYFFFEPIIEEFMSGRKMNPKEE